MVLLLICAIRVVGGFIVISYGHCLLRPNGSPQAAPLCCVTRRARHAVRPLLRLPLQKAQRCVMDLLARLRGSAHVM